MENNMQELKAKAISQIANSKCFIVITDNKEKENNLDTSIVLDNLSTAFEFLKIVKKLEEVILYPQPPKTPPSSNIIKT